MLKQVLMMLIMLSNVQRGRPVSFRQLTYVIYTRQPGRIVARLWSYHKNTILEVFLELHQEHQFSVVLVQLFQSHPSVITNLRNPTAAELKAP